MKSNNKIHYLTVLCMKIYEGILKNGKIGRFLHLFLPILCFCSTLTGVFFVVGCNSDRQESKVAACSDSVQFEPVGSDYFSIGKLCGVDVAVVRSVVGKDTLVHKYVMMDSVAAGLGTDLRRRGFPEEWQSAFVLRVPLKRVVALSTAQVGYMLRLGLRDNIIGVSDGQYIVDSILYERAKQKSVASIGYDAGALEKLMALSPDLVLDFTTGGDYDNYEQIARTSLPLMLTSEWQESSALAKLEWIKLYGILFGIRPLADSIYEQEKNKYETLKALIANSASRNGDVAGVPPARGGSERRKEIPACAGMTNGCSEGETSPGNNSEKKLSSLVSRHSSKQCPRVLAGMSYGGVWHASGGNSFTANLVRDAGGCYLWASDTSRELTFSFEQVYALADSVDMWVNPSAFGTVDEILSLEPRVKNIKAFREKKIFQNDGRKGPGGGNDFYEGAITRPAELLWNLTKCIKGAVPGVNSIDTSYKWYRNIYNF